MITREYMAMCSKVMDFYATHKIMINSVDGLEGYFANLHILLVNLHNHQKRLKTQITPLLKEKENQVEVLEELFNKFNTALGKLAVTKAKKAGRKKDGHPTTSHHSPQEIVDQYLHISERARAVYKDLLQYGLAKDDLHELDTLATGYILSLPIINLLYEKKDYAATVAKKMISEMDYIMIQQIDPQMAFFSQVDTTLYHDYQQCRKIPDHTAVKATSNGR
jgi:hypothetical protein